MDLMGSLLAVNGLLLLNAHQILNYEISLIYWKVAL